MDDIADLFNAVAAGDEAAVRRIIAEKPELARAKNADTLPIMHFARYMGQHSILEALVSAGPPLDLWDAAMLDRADRVREFVAARPDALNGLNAEGFGALHMAAFYIAPNAVRALIDLGAVLELRTDNFLSNMPLHAAAAGGDHAIIKMLLDAGADANARQHGGFTPLHTAAFHGDRAMAEMFLERGADPAATNDEGKTAADFGAAQGHTALAALLRAIASRSASSP